MTETQGCLTWPCGCKQAPTAPVDEYTFRCEQHGGRPTAGSVRVSLASWLLERVADDEEDARERLAQSTGIAGSALGSIADDTWRWHMTRKLAECAARRKIIELHDGSHECSQYDAGLDCGINRTSWSEPGDDCSTLRLLAAPYASEPGYRPEWAV